MMYEAHITVEAREDLWESFLEFASLNNLKASKAAPFPWRPGKWFLTAGDYDIALIKGRVFGTIAGLQFMGYDVVRWKIEATLLDSKDGATIDDLRNKGANDA